MSNHSISINDPRHARLYDECLTYDLCAEPLSMLVDSSRIAGLRYRVWIEDSDVFCNCATTSEDSCRHRAVCVAHFYPALWFAWFDAECREAAEFRHRIRTGARLTLSERRRRNKCIRLAEEMRANFTVRIAA